MAHRRLGAVVPQVAARLAAGDGLEGERRDELARPGGHDDLYLGAPFHEATHEIGALVSRNAAGHAQHDPFTIHAVIMVGAVAPFHDPLAICLSLG